MEIDRFLELVRRRRSIRRFKTDPIPDEYVEKIIEAGRWAMSGANAQPWEFIVVKSPETKEKLAQAWFEIRKEQHVIEMTRVPELRHLELARSPSIPGFINAPVLIVVCGDKRTLQATVLSANYINGEGASGGTYLKNMANATQNMHLAVAALGLGSEWCSVPGGAEELKVILNVPPLIDIHTIVAVGYPSYEPSPPYRRELKEIVHYEGYDRSRYRSGEDIINFLHKLRERIKPAYEQAYYQT